MADIKVQESVGGAASAAKAAGGVGSYDLARAKAGTNVDRRPEKMSANKHARHAKNPFLDGTWVSIHRELVGMGAKLAESEGSIAFTETMHLSKEDFDEKVLDSLGEGLMLSPAASKVLRALSRQVRGGELVGGKASLCMEACVEALGPRGITKTTYHRGISELLLKKVVARDVTPGLFHFKADLFGSERPTEDGGMSMSFQSAKTYELIPPATKAATSRSGMKSKGV